MRGQTQSPELVRAIDEKIVSAEQEIAETTEKLSARKDYLRSLKRARGNLVRENKPRTRVRKRRVPVPRTAAQRAGVGNIDAVRTVLRRGRRLGKPEIGRRLAELRGVDKINDGTVTYAIKALVESGDAVEVGIEGGSRVYEYVSRSAITRPGDR